MKKQLITIFCLLTMAVSALAQSPTKFEDSKTGRRFVYWWPQYDEEQVELTFKFHHGAIMPEPGDLEYERLKRWTAERNIQFRLKDSTVVFNGVDHDRDMPFWWGDDYTFRSIFGGGTWIMVNTEEDKDCLWRGPWRISAGIYEGGGVRYKLHAIVGTVDSYLAYLDETYEAGDWCLDVFIQHEDDPDPVHQEFGLIKYYADDDVTLELEVTPYKWWRYGLSGVIKPVTRDVDRWGLFVEYVVDLPEKFVRAYELDNPQVYTLLRTSLNPPAIKAKPRLHHQTKKTAKRGR